jgi:hypothetical protein
MSNFCTSDKTELGLVKLWMCILASVLLAAQATRADVVGSPSIMLRSQGARPMAASNVQAGPGNTSNLGSFSIVINAGATLAGNAPALAAFNRAAEQWESYISDPITVTIDADLAALGPNILGSASSVVLFDDHNTVQGFLVGDAGDEADDGIAGMIPNQAAAVFAMPPGFAVLADMAGDRKLSFTKANGKAMGYSGLDGLFGTTDATITFSSTFGFDFDNSDGVGSGLHDFETVAIHEIGHALGFISEVDYIDFRLDQAVVATDVTPTTLDLFRFSKTGADPSTDLEFSTFARSMIPSAGGNEIFDQIDGSYGGDVEMRMAMGVEVGDGDQASHWKADEITGYNIGVMDPTLAEEVVSAITANDLRAFDLIGYEISAVPEAGSFVLLSLVGTLSAAGVVMGRRCKERAAAQPSILRPTVPQSK